MHTGRAAAQRTTRTSSCTSPRRPAPHRVSDPWDAWAPPFPTGGSRPLRAGNRRSSAEAPERQNRPIFRIRALQIDRQLEPPVVVLVRIDEKLLDAPMAVVALVDADVLGGARLRSGDDARMI